MSAPSPLSSEAIARALNELPGWKHEGDALHKAFDLGSFRAALAFLVRIGFEAEQRNHHPEIFNVYGKVELTLRTHDAGNEVTEMDIELAKAIEALG
jgi:4a-hydroxytetrahydrobiopterin dehydratase